MKIASFNINGIKARFTLLCQWLQETHPDIVLLQEIKSPDENFPREEFNDMGYNVETHGQKSFNGVAILSRLPMEDVTRTLPNNPQDTQARWIEASIIAEKTSLRVASLYLPNGNPVPGEKYDYKCEWMARFEQQTKTLLAREEPIVLGGDYNIIPQDHDAENPQMWKNDALGIPKSRAAFRNILSQGYSDALRLIHPQEAHYTFWDFQRGAWERNDGIRIDHFLISPECADLLMDCYTQPEMRARQKPSDHVPIWIEINA